MSVEIPSSPSSNNEQAIPTAYVVVGVILALLLGIGLIVGILWLSSTFPAQIEAIRDVFIVALALESCLFGIVLMLMLVMMIRLVNTIEFEIKPILEQTNETIGTVRGTSRFVSKNVLNPVIKAKGYAAGIRRGTKALLGDPKKNLVD